MPTATAEKAAWSELAQIVGNEHLRAATAADTIDGVELQMVAAPATPEELARALRWANDAGLKVSPRGGGTKLGWGNPPSACDLILSTARLNRVLEHAWADMTAVVEAGCRLSDLQKTLAEHGQQLVIDPLWPEQATIGGILSTNDSGTLRVRYGSLRDLIIGATIALPDGTLAKSGGKVVKNVAGYDLPKLLTGALGTLGVIVQAIFRLHPAARQTRSLTFTGTPESLNQLLLAIEASKLAFTGLQLRAGKGKAYLDVRFAGTTGGIDAQMKQVTALAGTVQAQEPSADVWTSHQAIWADAGRSLVAKFSILPAHLVNLCSLLRQSAQAESLEWVLVAQAVGCGYTRLDGGESGLRNALLAVRDGVAKLDGSFVALGCPLAIKRGLDVWGPLSDAHPLMVRIKQQFDPNGTLNPRRFVGGI